MALSRPLSRSLTRPLSRDLEGGVDGFSLLQSYDGAAAAYSLQDISNSRGNVARARRSVDNEERNLTESDIGDPLRKFAMNDSDELLTRAKEGAMYFDGVNDTVSVSAITLTVSTGFRVDFSTVMQKTAPGFFGTSSTAGLYAQSLTTFNVTDDASATATLGTLSFSEDQLYRLSLRCDGANFELYDITESETLLRSVSVGSLSAITLDTLAQSRGRTLEGLLYDVRVSNTGDNDTWVPRWNGHGNANADWEDQVGSNDGTVNGSPALWTGQGFDAFVTTWYDQSQALGQPLSRFANRAQATDGRINFDGSDDYVELPFDVASCTNATVTFYDVLFTGTEGVLMQSGTSGSHFLLAMDTSASGGFHAGSGSPSIYVDDALFTGTTRNDLKNAIGDGSLHKVELRGCDLSAWPQNPRLGWFETASQYRFEGIIGRVTVDHTGNGTLNADYPGTGNTNADWEDQVGSNDGTVNGSPDLYEGLNATQSTSSAQPQIVADGVIVVGDNEEPALDFDGTKSLTPNEDLGSLSAYSQFAVASKDVGTGLDGLYSPSSQDGLLLIDTGSGSKWGSYRSSALNANSIISSTALMAVTSADALAINFFLNGSADGSASGGTIGQAPHIGGLSGGQEMDGKITEIIFYDSDQSANREAIEANIAGRYGITLS